MQVATFRQLSCNFHGNIWTSDINIGHKKKDIVVNVRVLPELEGRCADPVNFIFFMLHPINPGGMI